MAKRTTICAGIDTGKRKLDVAIDGSSLQLQVENTAEGHKVLLEWLRRHKVKRIGIEASGGYELPVVTELRRKRFVVVVFQPAQVRAYAKFHLQLAKNDKIDAALIAACTAAVKKIRAAPDPRLQPFAEHLTLIEQIGEDIKLYKNRIETCRDPRIQKLWKEEISRLAKRERAELKALVAAIRQHRDLAQRLDLIYSVSGAGMPTAVACRRSAHSAANKWPRSPGLHPTTMTAVNEAALVTSMADARGCAGRSIPPRCRHPFSGIRTSSPFTSG